MRLTWAQGQVSIHPPCPHQVLSPWPLVPFLLEALFLPPSLMVLASLAPAEGAELLDQQWMRAGPATGESAR